MPVNKAVLREYRLLIRELNYIRYCSLNLVRVEKLIHDGAKRVHIGVSDINGNGIVCKHVGLSNKLSHLNDLLEHGIINDIRILQDTSHDGRHKFYLVGGNDRNFSNFIIECIDNLSRDVGVVIQLGASKLAERS